MLSQGRAGRGGVLRGGAGAVLCWAVKGIATKIANIRVELLSAPADLPAWGCYKDLHGVAGSLLSL